MGINKFYFSQNDILIISIKNLFCRTQPMIKNHQSQKVKTLFNLPKPLMGKSKTDRVCKQNVSLALKQGKNIDEKDTSEGMCCEYTPQFNFEITFNNRRKKKNLLVTNHSSQRLGGMTERCQTQTCMENDSNAYEREDRGLYGSVQVRTPQEEKFSQQGSKINLKPHASESAKPLGDIGFTPEISVSQFDITCESHPKCKNPLKSGIFNRTQRVGKKALNMTLVSQASSSNVTRQQSPPVSNEKYQNKAFQSIQNRKIQNNSSSPFRLSSLNSPNRLKNSLTPKQNKPVQESGSKLSKNNTKRSQQDAEASLLAFESLQEANRKLKEQNAKLGKSNETRKNQVNFLLKQIQGLKEIVKSLMDPSNSSFSVENSSHSCMDQNIKKIENSLTMQKQEAPHKIKPSETTTDGERVKDRKQIAEDIGSKLKKVLGGHVNVSLPQAQIQSITVSMEKNA